MPAKKVNAPTDVIWGNKGIETEARLLPRTGPPVSTDPEWNELVDTLQDPAIGHNHDGINSASIAHAILGATHSDSLAAAPVQGDLIIANATPAWARFPKATAGSQFLGTTVLTNLPQWKQPGFSNLSGTAGITQIPHGHNPNTFFNAGTTSGDFTTTSATPVLVTGMSTTVTGRSLAQGARVLAVFQGGVKVSAATTTAEISIYVDGLAQVTQPFQGVTTFITTAIYLPQSFTDNVAHTFEVRVDVTGASGSITIAGTSYTSFIFVVDLGTGLPIA